MLSDVLIKEKLMVDEELLDILACPACKSKVEPREGKIICPKCSRGYPVRDDIPVMLIDEAERPKDHYCPVIS